MKKLIFILFSLICLNKLTAQIPSNWSQVPNEFMVLYKNNTPQQRSTGTILPHHYMSLSEVELWDMYRGKLRTVTGKNGYVQMPLHSVAVGNYMLRLIIDGQQVDNKPLMVR